MVKVEFNKNVIQLCENFSLSINTSYYATRFQTNNEKRILDQKIGKLGEVATYKAVKPKLSDLSKPDFQIYKVAKKSWSADLVSEKTNTYIHVKSQYLESVNKYGASWVFQKNDREIFKENNKNDYIAFVVINLPKNEGYIYNIVNLSYLHKHNLFEELNDPNPTKLRVVWENIENYKMDLI